MQNKIRELRQARGWSMERLGELMGNRSVSAIARLEKAKSDLTVEDMILAADIFGVSWSELLGIDETKPAADATELEPGSVATEFRLMPQPNERYFRVEAPALDAIGIEVGDLIIVDVGDGDRLEVQSLDALVIKRGGSDMHSLRQFIEPELFVTNSRSANDIPLTRSRDLIQIIGLITRRIASVHRAHGSNTPPTAVEKR